MTRFMIWLCLFFCIGCFCMALYHAYRGDFYGVVTGLCLSAIEAIYGYSFCRDRDAERKKKARSE